MILMCSDGLTNMLEDQEIFHIIKSSHDIREAAERLVSRAMIMVAEITYQ